jgi:hypothetical protein
MAGTKGQTNAITKATTADTRAFIMMRPDPGEFRNKYRTGMPPVHSILFGPADGWRPVNSVLSSPIDGNSGTMGR